MAVWLDDETLKLLELWGEESVQTTLEGCTSNKSIYDKIAAELNSSGYTRTGLQCRERIKKLKKDYKKTKDNLNETGNKRKICKFYEQINDILGDRPSTKPAIVIDSSAEQSELTTQTCAASSEDEQEETEDIPGKIDQLKEKGKELEFDKQENPGNEPEKEDDKQHTKIEMKKELNKKKKRLTREERMEKTMNVVIDKVMKRQRESDDKFVELEFKRMKMEERLMEMENERRKEDREFQVRMFSMMHQGPLPFPHMAPPHYSAPRDYSSGGSSSSSSSTHPNSSGGSYPMYYSSPSSPDIP